MNRPTPSTDRHQDVEALSIEQLENISGGLLADFQTFKVNPIIAKYVLPRINVGNIRISTL